MVRRLIVPGALLFFTSACSLLGGGTAEAPEPAPTATSETAQAPDPARGPSRSPCGDGVCSGPENPGNCPADCPAPTAPPLPAELPPLYVGLSVHLEGFDLGNSDTGYNEELYARYSEWILEYSDLSNEYGMPLTWESSILIGPSGALEPNILLELYRRGDGVGVHADLGGRTAPNESGRLVSGLRKMRQDMIALGVPVRHVSGVCSAADWVGAAQEAGFEAVTGVVEYCLKSLPVDQQPPHVQSCATPVECHEPYPLTLPGMLHPWLARSGKDWTRPAESGILIVPTAGEIKCLHESMVQPGSYTVCEVTREDVEAALRLIDEALAARESGRANQLFFVWSFGEAIEHDLLRSFFEGIQAHVEAGEAIWQTLPELMGTIEG